jgi:hypothetical protein
MFQCLKINRGGLLLTACLIILGSACTPIAVPATPTTLALAPTEIEPIPTLTEVVLPSPTPTGQAISIELGGVANSISEQIVPAVQKTADSAWWQAVPAYLTATLNNYPVAGPITPQIFVYPTQDLPAWNPDADKQVKDMQALLVSHLVTGAMPFLPLKPEKQVIQSAIKGIEFNNGQGVRYLTQYNSGIVPVNNQQLFYTFQGLTSDGRFYISAVLPVIYPGLPADSLSVPPENDPFWTDPAGYIAQTSKTLSEAPTSSFTPDLSTLDAMMSSLEVK